MRKKNSTRSRRGGLLEPRAQRNEQFRKCKRSDRSPLQMRKQAIKNLGENPRDSDSNADRCARPAQEHGSRRGGCSETDPPVAPRWVNLHELGVGIVQLRIRRSLPPHSSSPLISSCTGINSQRSQRGDTPPARSGRNGEEAEGMGRWGFDAEKTVR